MDALLDGGLLPGTLTVVVGATGIGKTQLGLQYANAGGVQEGRRGIVFDVSARGDSQGHAEYAARLFEWVLAPWPADAPFEPESIFDRAQTANDYLHLFNADERPVAGSAEDFALRHRWQVELNARLRTAIAFLYQNFVQGCRRVVVDGVEPVTVPAQSLQFQLFEYLYHQVLRKDAQWLARDVLRESYRQYADQVARGHYRATEIGCLLLSTSAESMLDDLISRPLEQGDVLSNANTLIYLGKVRQGQRLRRGLYVAKHRGSAASDRIVPYEITSRGLEASDTVRRPSAPTSL